MILSGRQVRADAKRGGVMSGDEHQLVRDLLDQRLGSDPGTLNFLYPYSRFMNLDDAECIAIEGWRQALQRRVSGVAYVHVPFCPAHCTFCGFSTTYGEGRARVLRYLDGLTAEAHILRDRLRLNRFQVDAVFVGGGTPNYLSADEFTKLTDGLRLAFAWDDSTEWTVEIYPSAALSTDVLPRMRELGVNRISVAAQDFNDDVLSRSLRRYNGAEALEVARQVRALGFPGMNIDFMIGIPGQSAENAAVNLAAIDELQPTHVTLNPFSNRSPAIPLNRSKFKNTLMPTTGIRGLYRFYQHSLLQRGYRQIGKANFERDNAAPFRYEALVRRSAFRLGLGSNALSFNGSSSYRNADNINPYERMTISGSLPVTASYALQDGDVLRSAAFYEVLGGGFDVGRGEGLYGTEANDFLNTTAEVLEEYGLARMEGSYCRLTDDGIWNTGIVQRAFLPEAVLRAIVGHRNVMEEVHS